MGSGFKDNNYCMLINYTNTKDSGTHCIIDIDGKIVFKQKNILNYLYYLKDVIATMDKEYYNLLTGEIITKGSNSINSENYLFVENRYNKEFALGVYRIEYSTGKFEIFQ